MPGCYLPRITAAAPQPFLASENRTSWAALWLAWARGSFRNFRLNEQQVPYPYPYPYPYRYPYPYP